MSDASSLDVDTHPLLRQHQVDDLVEEKARLEGTLKAPPHISSQIQNRGEMVKQLHRLNHQLETQTPRAFETGELDTAVALEKQFREEMVEDGMPTQAEMRRNPPGAVDIHRGWEDRNKIKWLQWKNLRLRLQASGALPDTMRDARDVANFEQFRPRDRARELSLDNAQIEGKIIHLPPPGSGPAVVMNDAQAECLKQYAPDLLLKMALLDSGQRAEVLTMADRIIGVPAEEEQPVQEKAPAEKKGLSGYRQLQKHAASLGIKAVGVRKIDLEAAIAAKNAEG